MIQELGLMLLIDIDEYRVRRRDLDTFKYALLTADPDRYGPQLFGNPKPLPEDNTDLLDSEGNVDYKDMTIKYEAVPDQEDVKAMIAKLMGDRTVTLTPKETAAALSSNGSDGGWR